MNKVVEAQDLWRVYRLDRVEVPALRGVTLSIEEGEFTALRGPSGCGKSTLLHLLGCLDRPTRGRLLFRGEDVSRLGDAALTRIRACHVGFVFQNFNLMPQLTAKDNVVLGLRLAGLRGGKAKRLAEEALERVGLGPRAKHRPGELSGGERQRLSIARALAKGPELLFADEPTGNLDSAMSQEIISLLSQLHKEGLTIFMVTHAADLAQAASKTLTMRDGQIVNPTGA